MGRMGRKEIKWTDETETQLITEISKGKKMIQLTTLFKMSSSMINRKLKHMGFDNFSDAKKVLYN